MTDWLKGRRMLVAGILLVFALASVIWLVFFRPDRLEASGGSFVRDGEAGFVVTQFAYALGPDTEGTDACPNGMSKNVAEIFGETPEGKRRLGEGDEEFGMRIEAGGQTISATAEGKNFCMHPALAPRDPHTRILSSADATGEGIDLDGKISRSSADDKAEQLDFVALDGTEGVDNQFWRAIGCNRSYQAAGLSNVFGTEMYTGSWGILIALEGVDDLQNDDSVTVHLYANADPMQLSPTREALEYATYAFDQDEAFQASSSGRIENGVLTSEPVNARFRHVTNAMHLVRPLRDARIRAILSADGTLKGILGGYTPITAMYDFQFGYRNAGDGAGGPAPMARILQTANGAARVLGHTCQGAWQSLHRLADGHLDPKTGKFTSISTQYAFEARPAFIVDIETDSVNEELVGGE